MRGRRRPARLPRHIPSQALIIREWALRLLGTEAGPSDLLWAMVAGGDPAAWSLFLHRESCALPLQTRMDAGGSDAWSRLPSGIGAMIREVAGWELRHVLSARAQLRVIAQLARERGWQIVVLKGGAAVADGELLFLGDVDILVDRELVMEVGAALGELGFDRRGNDSETAHHLASRITPNAVRIEVHRALKGGAGLEAYRDAILPLAGEPALWRLGPADNLRYQPIHSTIQHPERIGRLRELLLISHTLREESPEIAVAVEEELAEHEASDLTLGVLRAARELRDRSYVDDHFRQITTRIYTLYHRFGVIGQHPVGVQILSYSGKILGRGWRYWWPLYRQLRAAPTKNRSSFGPAAWLHGRVPVLDQLVRQLQRLIVFIIATTFAVLVIGESRVMSRGNERRRGDIRYRVGDRPSKAPTRANSMYASSPPPPG